MIAPSNGTNTTSTENQSSRSSSAEDNETAAERVRRKYLERYFCMSKQIIWPTGRRLTTHIAVRHVLDDPPRLMLRASAW